MFVPATFHPMVLVVRMTGCTLVGPAVGEKVYGGTTAVDVVSEATVPDVLEITHDSDTESECEPERKPSGSRIAEDAVSVAVPVGWMGDGWTDVLWILTGLVAVWLQAVP